MNKENVVWTAVVAVALGLASVISAVESKNLLALSFGLTSITSAILSNREN